MSSNDSDKLSYHCRICDLGFQDEESFMRHVDAKGHSFCKPCKISLDSDGALLAHIDEFHYRLGNFCRACNTLFQDEGAMYSHKHCSICKGSFVDRATLEDHTSREHPIRYSFVSCTSCYDTFKDRDALAKHVVEVHSTVQTKSEPTGIQNWAFPGRRTRTFMDFKKSENKIPSLLGQGDIGMPQHFPSQLESIPQAHTYNNGQLSPDERIAPVMSDNKKSSEQQQNPQLIGPQPFTFNHFLWFMDQPLLVPYPWTFTDSQQSLHSQVTALPSQIPSDKQVALERPVAVNGSFYDRSHGVLKEKALAINPAVMGNSQPLGARPMEGVEVEKSGEKRKNREETRMLFNCIKCPAKLISQDRWHRHIYNVHFLGIPNHQRSRRNFRERNRLYTHEHVPQNPTILTCGDCDKTLEDHKALREHSMTFHTLRFPCNQCRLNFESAGGLSNHLDSHKPAPLKELLFCFPCGALFTTIDGLQQHLGSSVHKKDKPIVNCIIGGTSCGKFLSLSQLVVHWESGKCMRVFDRNQIVQFLNEYDTGKEEEAALPIRKRQRIEEI